MSWDKNTVILSEVNKTIELLKEFGVPYKLKVLKKVVGNGNNDDLFVGNKETSRKYDVRRLEYKDKVILEQMNRSADCDCNDVIISLKFNKDKVPEKWEPEVENE